MGKGRTAEIVVADTHCFFNARRYDRQDSAEANVPSCMRSRFGGVGSTRRLSISRPGLLAIGAVVIHAIVAGMVQRLVSSAATPRSNRPAHPR